MPTYSITAPNGKTLDITGERVPTEAEMHDIFKAAGVETGAQSASAPAPQSMAEKVRADLPQIQADESARLQSGRDFLTGVGKSIYGAVEGGGKLLRDTFPILNKGPEVTLPISSQPTNRDQQIGKTVGNVAQFFAPGAGVTKLKAATATGVGVLDALVGAGMEGASAAGVQSLQQGDTKGTGVTALTAGGTSIGSQVLAKSLGYLGQKVEQALVKPTQADVRNGFQVGNIFRYKLGGSLSQTFDKAEAKLAELSTKLQNVLKQPLPNGGAPQVDVLGSIADAAAELQQRSARTFGQNNAIGNAVDKLLNDPLLQRMQNGTADLSTANQIKQAIGDLGAWLHDPSGRVMVDPESKAMETVANAVYAKLKTAIEQKAIGPLASINRQIGDIIPIRQAVIRRIPVEQRSNVLNLGDLLSFSSGHLGLAMANRALKSGEVANGFNAVSEMAPAVGAGTGRTAGAASSQMTNR